MPKNIKRASREEPQFQKIERIGRETRHPVKKYIVIVNVQEGQERVNNTRSRSNKNLLHNVSGEREGKGAREREKERCEEAVKA